MDLGIILALVPAFAWGSIGLISGSLGGNARQQTLGMTTGAVFFGLFVLAVFHPDMSDPKLWLSGMFSGLFWALGQSQQFTSMKAIGISKTVPISTGLQLAGNALAGVFLFHEWKNSHMLTVGTIAVLILIFGAVMTSLRDKSDQTATKKTEDARTGIRAMTLSTIGYVLYTIVIKYANVDAKAVVLPQAIGMLIGALVFVLLNHGAKEIATKPTAKNIITGLVWGIGNLFMFLAVPQVGLAISYSLAQSGIVISTFGSIYLLGEKKTHREMIYVIVGSVFVIVGSTMLGSLQ